MTFSGLVDRKRWTSKAWRVALGVDELSLPEDPTIANRAQGPKPELSDLVRQNLRQWYAKDYEFLGLCDQLFPLESRPNSS